MTPPSPGNDSSCVLFSIPGHPGTLPTLSAHVDSNADKDKRDWQGQRNKYQSAFLASQRAPWI